ncbi:phosphate ABC transporter substrate-binding protein [Photobacterium rosenbergii]|uniref:Phosphate ABC transporter substrate-binding protein n=1 Tax=Photobacterium rosenbergii TaxID=294936 RepID=A0A2T3NF59_9GAMM|nr:phosphate/phosphite/phosphonate ABC transporter substrate-binding protein [Photobacterium rosenbergii]PSW13190.1 phosphate ABC transporter substrate-binding protein [Photobacterium rosenbergii]
MRINLKSKITHAFIALAVCFTSGASASQEPAEVAKQTLVFGVVPQQSAAKLAVQWGPLLKVWGEVTGLDIRFATARDIPTFEQRLAAGEYDIAYMNPYHFTLVNQTPGYTALARAKDKRITGIMVARKDWQGSLDELDNTSLAFPAPRAFAASILTQSELRQKGLSISANYVGSHDSVYMAVARGLYPAGGGVMRTYNSLDESIKQHLTVIYRTNSYTPHAIAFSKSLDKSTTLALQQSLTAVNEHADAQAVFEKLSIKGLEPALDSDWDDVVSLDIEM